MFYPGSRILIRPFSHPGSGSKHLFIPNPSWKVEYFFSCFLCFLDQSLRLSHSQKDQRSGKNSSRIQIHNTVSFAYQYNLTSDWVACACPAWTPSVCWPEYPPPGPSSSSDPNGPEHKYRYRYTHRINMLKGTVSRDFRPLVFFTNQPHLGPWLTG
jgi:hypothetical protein